MPGTSDSVTITIQTVDASSGVISNVETKLGTLGTTGTAASAKMATMAPALEHAGAAGATFASNATAATAGAGASYENLRGKMDSVRLASEEMGLHVPRAMARVIGSNATLAAGLQATMGLFIAIGAVAIFEQAIEGAAHLYEKWFDVNKEVDAFYRKSGEAADTKLIDTASLETTSALLSQIQDQIDELQKNKAESIVGQPGGGFLQYFAGGAGVGHGMPTENPLQTAQPFTAAMDKELADRMEKLEKLDDHAKLGAQQVEAERLKGQTAYDGAALQGYAKRAALDKDEIAAINNRYDTMQMREEGLIARHNAAYDEAKASGADMTGMYRMKPADTELYARERGAAIGAQQAGAAGQSAGLARAEQQTIITAQNEATNSHLVGIALVQSQEEQAIDAVVRKFYLGEISKQGMIALSAAIWEKFEAQKLLKMEEEQRLVDAAFAHAAQVGDTGTKAIRNEQQDKIAAIPIGTDPEKAVGLRVAYEQEGDNKVRESREKFVQEMAQIDQRADDQMLQGYARVDAEAGKLITAAQTKFTEANKGANMENPVDYAKYAAEYQAEQDAETRILGNAERERTALAQKTNEQITQMEAEAARASLPPWQAAQERIVDDYQKRLAAIQADVNKQVISEQEGARAATAAWQLANNEIERQQQETRDRLAGELSSLFDNPAKYMEARAKQLMMDILANWVMQLTEAKGPMGSAMSWIFGMNPEMSTSTNPKTALGSIFGSHTAAHGAAGAGASSTLIAADHALVSAGSTVTAAGDTLNTAGLKLSAAADVISAAMQGFGSGAAAGGGGGGGGGGGVLTPGGGTGDFTDAITSGVTAAINAPTSSSGVMGTPPGMSAGAIGQGTAALTTLLSGSGGGAAAMGESIPLLTTLAKGGVFGSAVQSFASGGGVTMPGAFNAGGPSGGTGALPSGVVPFMGGGGVNLGATDQGFYNGTGGPAQTSDVSIGATEQGFDYGNGAGPQGDILDIGATEDGAQTPTASGGSGFGLAQGMGIGMAGIGAGMTFAQNWGNPNMGQAVLSDAMAGASLGTAIMPGIGTAIGAIGGALIGIFGSLFGDQGASKMRQYNEAQVKPAIGKEMTAYTAAEVGYDQGMQDMEMMQLKAQSQAKQWGSGAVGVYTHTVAPEIAIAIAEMQRQQDTDRSGAIEMQAAQYDSGGVIAHFGDLSTGPNSGFIHAQVGERMLDRMTNMRHSSTLDSMTRGGDISRGSGTLGGNSSSGGGTVQIVIQALDSKSVSDWLRMGGAQQIQSHLNANAGRYAGKALS